IMPSSNSHELSRVVRRKSKVFRARSEATAWLHKERHHKHNTSACTETKVAYSTLLDSRASDAELGNSPGWKYIKTMREHRTMETTAVVAIRPGRKSART